MFKHTCLIAPVKRVMNLQILDPGSPHTLVLEILGAAFALKRDHLIMGHTINQIATNMYYECME
jgi:hypothetical protein